MGIAAMIERLDNWPKLLGELIEYHRMMPFIWGINDCGTFALAAYAAMTGKQIVDRAVPRNSQTSFLRLVASTPEGVLGLAKQHFGDNPLSDWRQARRGDLALVKSPRIGGGIDEAMGVVLGGNVAAPGPEGLEFLSLQTITKVWRIG